MAAKEKTTTLARVRWSLWRLITAPAVWFGSVTGTAVGIQMAQHSTTGAGIGFGMMIGIVSAIMARGVHLIMHRTHEDHVAKESLAEAQARDQQEQGILQKLQAVGLSEELSILQKVFDARDAIVQQSAGADVSPERSAPTLSLVAEITRATLLRAEELVDLKRRVEDPLLDAPSDAVSRMDDCRADLARAYRAVADARTRMLLKKELTADELLEPSRDGPGRGIDGLAGQLEEETMMLRGVERRMNQRSLDQPSDFQALEGETTSTRNPESE